MFAAFFDWWFTQLRDLMPDSLRALQGGTDALILDASQPGQMTVQRRRGPAINTLTRLTLDEAGLPGLRAALNARPRGEPVLLRVAPGLVLERTVTLPLAAERDLVRVLGYEMERLTPFTAAELIWHHAVTLRDRARARLTLRLTMVTRASIDPLIQLLKASGATPEAIEATLPDGPRTLKLAGDPAGRAKNVSTRSLAVAAAGLALFVLATPFLRQQLEIAALNDRLQELSPRIAQVEALRRRIAGAGAGGDVVAAETRRVGDTLEALAAMTDILPNDSYLTEFTMRERKITLAGLGASAPKLISALSADPHIRNPAFTAPVTRSETNHLDVFAIRAELAPGGAP